MAKTLAGGRRREWFLYSIRIALLRRCKDMIPWDRQLSKRHVKRGYINVQEEVTIPALQQRRCPNHTSGISTTFAQPIYIPSHKNHPTNLRPKPPLLPIPPPPPPPLFQNTKDPVTKTPPIRRKSSSGFFS